MDRQELVDLIERRIGQDFDGECHLSEHEAREIIAIIRGDEGWRPTSEAPEAPGTYIDVRSITTYRWLAYKPDGARQMKKPGRWQMCGEYGGWTNAELPECAEFVLNLPSPPKPVVGVGLDEGDERRDDLDDGDDDDLEAWLGDR